MKVIALIASFFHLLWIFEIKCHIKTTFDNHFKARCENVYGLNISMCIPFQEF